jgi:hypothetical protein
MSASCKTPISWLRLERHHLGEPMADREAITDHLRSCSECAALLARIADDTRELPPLAQRPPPPIRRPWYMRPRVRMAASGLALAAMILLVIGRRSETSDDAGTSARFKGSDVSFTLVREDEAIVAEAGGSYRDGERFKAVVTCPPGSPRASFDVAVFEDGATTFPLPPSVGLSCGNGVALPGAFRITGHERMTVCLLWQADGPIDREAIQRTSLDRLTQAHCKTLDPSP